MKKAKSNTITPGEVTFLLIGSMVGAGILSLPNELIATAKQDAWISAFIGALYPLYMVIIASFLCKSQPEKNILVLSKKCFGEFIGSVLNIVFLLYFVLLVTAITFQVCIIKVNLIVPFISMTKIIIVILALAAYTVIKGLKVLGRVNQLMFLNTIILCLVLASVLSKGTMLNIYPILGSGVLNIIKAGKQSFFAYGGIEIIFLIYPFITDKTRIMKSSMKSVLITAIIYTWVTFITIYIIGIDIISKTLWPVNRVLMTVEFTFIFIVLWAAIMIKTISNNYFAVAFILKDLLKKAEMKTIVYAIYPLLIYLTLKYSNTAIMTNFLNYIIPKYTLFNMVYVTIIALIIYFKKDKQNEKQNKTI